MYHELIKVCHLSQTEMCLEQLLESFTSVMLMISACIAPGCQQPKLMGHYLLDIVALKTTRVIKSFSANYIFLQKTEYRKAIE